MLYRDSECSTCGRTPDEDSEFRIAYASDIGMVLCQNPAYRRGESDRPGCQDKIVEATKEWANSQGQQEVGEFL